MVVGRKAAIEAIAKSSFVMTVAAVGLDRKAAIPYAQRLGAGQGNFQDPQHRSL